MNRQELQKKTRAIAGSLLYQKGYIAPVDVLLKMEKLSPKAYEDWRFARVPYLEKVVTMNLSQLSFMMKELRCFARENNLKASWTAYHKWGKGKSMLLRFSKSGYHEIEKAYATHFLSGDKKNTPGAKTEPNHIEGNDPVNQPENPTQEEL